MRFSSISLVARIAAAVCCAATVYVYSIRAATTDAPAAQTGTSLHSGIERDNFDTSVKPGDDFFSYVNGAWIKTHPIPADRTSWGSFAKLGDDNLHRLRNILDGLAKETGPLEGERQKLHDLYLTATDMAKRDSQGTTPLADELAAIDKIDSRQSLQAELAHLRVLGFSPLFNLGVGQDEKISTRTTVGMSQGGLGLPERDYYLGTRRDSRRMRELYEKHVAKMLELLGDSPEQAAKGAATVLKLETRLAEKSRTPLELNDRENNYNKLTRKELDKLMPHFDWPAYFAAIELPGVTDVVVGQPEFFQRVDEMLDDVPPEQWRTYLRWQLIHDTAPYLTAAIDAENFYFYSQTLRGVKEMEPQWKRAVHIVDSHLGQPLGKLYVAEYFPPAAKKRMDELVRNVMAAYRDRIESRDWMGPQTKEQALAKLATVRPKIGYPAKWRDYSQLEIRPDSLVQNILRVQKFETRYNFNKLGKPIDRSEWGLTPPTVNAYYNPFWNEIVFPAGILQPPFFYADADDAVNYGSIGAVIGHEITHGFDDQGSRSDGDGNLRNWWTAEDRQHFTAKADALVKEYDACVAIDDWHVNGKLTLSENLADLGGVTIAYAAYQKSLAGQPAPVIDGFTGPQRFYIGFAHVWCGKLRDADIRFRLRTDGHSPPRFRSNVPLSNVQAFYDSFNVKPGDSMYRDPKDRVEVW